MFGDTVHLSIGIIREAAAGEARRIEVENQRWLFIVGLLLLFSGLVHSLVFAIDQGQWTGDVSWRKPILFGLSTGVTLLSLAWIFTRLQPKPSDAKVGFALAVSALIEVGLITIQTWRGVPSHFNTSTTIDQTVDYTITFFTLILAIGIFYLTYRSAFQLRGWVNSDIALSIQAGCLFLTLSCLFGLWMVYYGHGQQALGKPHSIYGEAGVLKFVHGVPIHAIQWLPLLAFWLYIVGTPLRERTRLLIVSIISVVLFTLFSVIQTFSGLARFDMTPLSFSILILSLVLFIWPLASGGCSLYTNQKPLHPNGAENTHEHKSKSTSTQ